MKLVKTLLCSAAVALGVSGCCCGSKCGHPFPPVEDAIASPLVAKTLRSVKIVFTVKSDELKDPATFTVNARVPASARFDFITKEAAFVAGFNGDRTWGYDNASGPYELTADEAQVLRNTLIFIPVDLKIKKPFDDMKWVKDETIDGEEYSCFQAVLKKSPATLFVWVSKKTNLIYKLEETDGNETAITVFADYKDYEGVNLPSSIYVSNPDGQCDVMHIKSVRWNLDFESDFFQCPSPLKK